MSRNFGRSSRQAWSLLKKLDPNKSTSTGACAEISFDVITAQIKGMGWHEPRHRFENNVRYE